MHTDNLDAAMVESINHIGHVMNLTTVAEYAENEAIIEKLRQLEVDYVQGYAISIPIPLDELLAVTNACQGQPSRQSGERCVEP
jgi:EAL domain-containing protein (putative c-di-GMP-specific phosphodiesterase class I)